MERSGGGHCTPVLDIQTGARSADNLKHTDNTVALFTENYDNHIMRYEKLQFRDSVVNAESDFWIGDPCYVVPDELWLPFCNNWSDYEKRHNDNPETEDLPRCYVASVEHEYTGYVWYAWSTAYGDGSYRLFVRDEHVATLGVDAGTLSAIPVGLIEHWKKTGQIGDYESQGHVVSAEHLQGELRCDEGDTNWGDMSLPTGYQDGQDEDEEECMEAGYFFR